MTQLAFSNFRIAFLAFALSMLVFAGMAHAEEAAQDMTRIGDAELQTLRGGFTLPNGANITVGIDNTFSINGVQVADAALSLVGSTVKSTTTGLGQQITGVSGGITNILQLAALGPTVISNSQNNVVLNQLRTINIDISNYSSLSAQMQSVNSAVQSQAMNAIRNSIH